MEKKNVAIIGATGLIGHQLLTLLLKDTHFADIYVITRRDLMFEDERVKNIVIDFSDQAAFKKALSFCDVVFCSVGTTQKQVNGDKVAYRKIDVDIPEKAAQFCEENGGTTFLLVSSVGADSKSGNFYLALKGEVEDYVVKRNIPSITIFRPSLLLGNRKEFRVGEIISTLFMKPLAFLVPSIYKPIEAAKVAKSMYQTAVSNRPGVHIYHFVEMNTAS
jgi:uncharacterized protein YbjT (DUF2867 family)